ncbi:MAG: hypothetical protein R3215_00135 [Halomonas sp.]|nr:hypothetical protein [Halomonas sp.]
MRTYSDAVIEHYADRFMGLRLARHGVSLEQYLADPQRYEERALDPEPPLPRQRAVALRLWWAWDTGLAHPSAATSAPVESHWSDGLIRDWRAHLAQWRDAEARVERDVDHLPRQNNGRIVEPLHHHRHPRSGAANFTKRGA